eukprot:COSAG01_NODE_70327_length_259_cov_0.512500_1_plen_53_part_01
MTAEELVASTLWDKVVTLKFLVVTLLLPAGMPPAVVAPPAMDTFAPLPAVVPP